MFIAGHSGWSESGMPESYNIYFVLRNEYYLHIITVWDSGIWPALLEHPVLCRQANFMFAPQI